MKAEFITKIELRDPTKTWDKETNTVPDMLRAKERLTLDDSDFNVIQLLASGAIERVVPIPNEIAKDPKIWDEVKPEIDTRTERSNSVYQAFADKKSEEKKKK